MKVGVYLDEYIPQDGGGHTFQSEISSALFELASESGHQFVILSSRHKQRLTEAKLELVEYPPPGFIEKLVEALIEIWPGLRNRLDWTSSLEKVARQAGAELIWFLGPRAKSVDLPYVTTVLDLQHRLQPWFPEVSQRGEWENREKHYIRLLQRAAAVITGTKAGKKEIVELYQIPEERVHILPHPTPVHASATKPVDDIARIRNLGVKPGYLLYPAQFWAHKNHINLLLALKQLKEEGKIFDLALVGADFGNLHYVKEQIKELSLGDLVHILGFVEQQDLLALYRNALALTYVSFFGPENLPPLEAFALGCPVIAAQVNGAEEQLGEAALLVDPKDPNAIASAIVRIANDVQLRAQLIERGRKRAASWTTKDFVRGAFHILDSFEPVRRTWKD